MGNDATFDDFILKVEFKPLFFSAPEFFDQVVKI
jgi:hypothetical protein